MGEVRAIRDIRVGGAKEEWVEKLIDASREGVKKTTKSWNKIIKSVGGGKIRLKMGGKINYKQNKIQTKKKEK